MSRRGPHFVVGASADLEPAALAELLRTAADHARDRGLKEKCRVWLVALDPADPVPAALDAAARELREVVSVEWVTARRADRWIEQGVA